MIDRDPLWDEAAPVLLWLGLGTFEPEGLHGRQRRRLVQRHTRRGDAAGDARSLVDALTRTYPLGRERGIVDLLGHQQLDDDLWRAIYALIVTGGPVRLDDLVRSLALLVSGDRYAADEEAGRLHRAWAVAVHRG